MTTIYPQIGAKKIYCSRLSVVENVRYKNERGKIYSESNATRHKQSGYMKPTCKDNHIRIPVRERKADNRPCESSTYMIVLA